MSEAATDTICDGATSMYSTRSAETSWVSPLMRTDTSSPVSLPSSSTSALAWAIT